MTYSSAELGDPISYCEAQPVLLQCKEIRIACASRTFLKVLSSHVCTCILQGRDGKVPPDLPELAGEALLQLYAKEAPSKLPLVTALLEAQQVSVAK